MLPQDEALYAPDIDYKEFIRLYYELVNDSAALWFFLRKKDKAGKGITGDLSSSKEKG